MFIQISRSLQRPQEERSNGNSNCLSSYGCSIDSFGLDADDFRTAIKLNSFICDNESDSETSEEEQVAEILGLADKGTEAEHADDPNIPTGTRKDLRALLPGLESYYMSTGRAGSSTQKSCWP